MKTNFIQNRRPGIAVAIAVVVSLVTFNPSSVVFPVKSTFETVVVMLQSGVTGEQVQQALDALPERGGVVLLPPETITIRRPLVLCRDLQTLSGSGTMTLLQLADDANCPVIIMGEPV